MLFCSCYDVSYPTSYCYSAWWAQTQQSPIVVCSSFLTSSNMSKNFTEVKGRGYKGGGFHCPAPKPLLNLVSKKLRSRTVSDVLFTSVPLGVFFFS
jgi:hypothetical protein